MNSLKELENKIQINFHDPDLLQQAFIHRSYLNEYDSPLGHNERLEFFGDAVLELIVTEYLYQKFPDKGEGELTALRSALVKRDTLKEIADELEFHKYLKLSKGEAKTANYQATILSNTVEAFIGALFLDAGIKPVKNFLNQYLLSKLDIIIDTQAHIDAKSNFQEIAQEHDSITPTYQVVSESGPDHHKIFKVAVYIGEKEIAQGSGNSKQAAEVKAATKALKKYPASK